MYCIRKSEIKYYSNKLSIDRIKSIETGEPRQNIDLCRASSIFQEHIILFSDRNLFVLISDYIFVIR